MMQWPVTKTGRRRRPINLNCPLPTDNCCYSFSSLNSRRWPDFLALVFR